MKTAVARLREFFRRRRLRHLPHHLRGPINVRALAVGMAQSHVGVGLSMRARDL